MNNLKNIPSKHNLNTNLGYMPSSKYMHAFFLTNSDPEAAETLKDSIIASLEREEKFLCELNQQAEETMGHILWLEKKLKEDYSNSHPDALPNTIRAHRQAWLELERLEDEITLTRTVMLPLLWVCK